MSIKERKELYNSIMDEISGIVWNVIDESSISTAMKTTAQIEDVRTEGDENDPYSFVQSDYFDESKNAYAIDAWTDNDGEEEDSGRTVAYVDAESGDVTYIIPEAVNSRRVQEEIESVLKSLGLDY